jgi:hypothetical protein
MNTTIHLVVARYSQWDQWTPVKGFTSEDDAKAFAELCIDANDREQRFFDGWVGLAFSNMEWATITEEYEDLRKLHPASEFRGRDMEYQVQPLEVVSSA